MKLVAKRYMIRKVDRFKIRHKIVMIHDLINLRRTLRFQLRHVFFLCRRFNTTMVDITREIFEGFNEYVVKYPLRKMRIKRSGHTITEMMNRSYEYKYKKTLKAFWIRYNVYKKPFLDQLYLLRRFNVLLHNYFLVNLEHLISQY